jgi:hypothetical protein
LKSEIQQWYTDLDPKDTRCFDTYAELAYIPQDDFSSSQDSYASRSIASINSLEIEEIDIVQASGTTPPTATVTHSEVSDLSSNIVDSSEVENLRAEVKRYQEELESYRNKMEKFQDLLESILIQVGKLSVPPPDSTDNKDSSQEGRQRK